MGVTSDAQLCSISLLRIGQQQTVDSLDEDTSQAAACKAMYANARDAVLELLDWPFARRRAVLAALTLTRTEWDFVYALPADCLAPRRIVSGIKPESADDRIPFDIEGDATVGTNRILLTDQEDATLLYTAITPNPVTNQPWPVALMSPLFVDALAWKLAGDLTLALPVKPGTLQLMNVEFEKAFARAGAAARNQLREPQPPTPRFITARE